MKSSAKRTVYVLNGYSSGGAHFIDYHVGWVLFRHFGFDCVVVQNSSETPFEYPEPFRQISLDDYFRTVADNDITVTTAGASSLELSRKVPGLKLMYVQGCLFANLDGFYDQYVFVSKYVHDFYRASSNFGKTIIPAFIRIDPTRTLVPWSERSPSKVALVGKFQFDHHIEMFTRALRDRTGGDQFELVPIRPSTFWTKPTSGNVLRRYFNRKPPKNFRYSNADLVAKLGEFRYVVSLAQSEGFGLIPLEAMASGCCVLGFHGGGGLEYMRDGIDCAVVDYPSVDIVADRLVQLSQDPISAEALAAAAIDRAQDFSRDVFEANWKAYFKRLLTDTVHS